MMETSYLSPETFFIRKSGKDFNLWKLIKAFNILFTEFEKYLNEALKLWKDPFFSVSSTKKPLHLLIYEDLIKDPIKEIRKIINFLKMKSGFEPADLEQRLLCMSENLQGDYKRKSRVLKAIPFTEERIKQMHAMISSAESMLSSSHNEMRLPKYEIWQSKWSYLTDQQLYMYQIHQRINIKLL